MNGKKNRNWNRKIALVCTAVGMIVLLGGLLAYGLGATELLPVPRPELVAAGTTLIGTVLLVTGACELFVKKTKEIEIEERDERNVAISNAAMAAGFKVMSMAVALCIAALLFTGYMGVAPGFILIGAYFLGQTAFIFTLVKLERTM